MLAILHSAYHVTTTTKSCGRKPSLTRLRSRICFTTASDAHVPGVHDQPAEEVRPGDVIHGVLLWSDCACCDLCIQVVGEHAQKTEETEERRPPLSSLQHWHRTLRRIALYTPRLHREGLVQELLIEVLLDVMHKDNSLALVVELWPSCSTHHLKNIWNGNDRDQWHWTESENTHTHM